MEKKQNKGASKRSTMTINGRVSMSRRHYHSKDGGTETPSDKLLDAMEQTISQATRDLCVKINHDARGFTTVHENLKSAAQIDLSKETIRQVVEADGKLAVAMIKSGELQPDFKATDCKNEKGESVIYGSVDGFMAPTVTDAEKQARRKQTIKKRQSKKESEGQNARPQRPLPSVKTGTDGRYKEFKATIFFTHDMEHKQVSVTRGDCEAAGIMMLRDAGRLDYKHADHRIALIDGGPWIINQIQKRNLKTTAIGLDFYHLMDNVRKTRRIVFGEENPAGEKWVSDLMHKVKHENFEALHEELLTLRQKYRGNKRREIDRLIAYASDRRTMIHYAEFIKKGWHIGTGAMESQCRITPDRVKGSGKRWDPDNAEGIMALETLQQNGQMKAFRQLAMAGNS